MWSINRKVLTTTACSSLKQKASKAGLMDFQKRHFVAGGKEFFYSYTAIVSLKDAVRQIDEQTNFFDIYEHPVVQHAFMLVKSAGGPATPMHQDRPFWYHHEAIDPVSLVTIWFALEEIDESRGTLCLNKENLTSTYADFNSKTKIYEHEKLEIEGSGNFGQSIVADQACDLLETMQPISMSTGDMVIFDAYEPHSSTEHTGTDPRCAFKIVVGEKSSLNNFMISYKRLLATPAILLYFSLNISRWIRKLNYLDPRKLIRLDN